MRGDAIFDEEEDEDDDDELPDDEFDMGERASTSHIPRHQQQTHTLTANAGGASDSDDSDAGPRDMEAASRQLDREAAEEECVPPWCSIVLLRPSHSLLLRIRKLAEEEMQRDFRDAERLKLPSGEELATIDPSSEDLQVLCASLP